MCLLSESTNWQIFDVEQDERNRSSVRLYGVQSDGPFCLNDLLVQNSYAAVVGDRQPGTLCKSVIGN